MRLKEKYRVGRHTVWVFGENGRELGVDLDHNIADEAPCYIFEGGKAHGEGCKTVWYPSLEVAKAEIRRLFESGESVATGRDAGLCKRCQNHYSYGSAGWKKYPPFACGQFKGEHVEKLSS